VILFLDFDGVLHPDADELAYLLPDVEADLAEELASLRLFPEVPRGSGEGPRRGSSPGRMLKPGCRVRTSNARLTAWSGCLRAVVRGRPGQT